MPKFSNHIANRKPTAIRNASVQFALRQDDCRAINVAIGNVSLPMHPAMQERLRHLTAPESPFADGIVRYAPTLGLSEARQAFRNIIGASGYYADNLYIQVTDGGSQAMELVIVACCGDAGNANMPAMLIDAAYTNYRSFAQRLGRRIVSFPRRLDEEGNFNLPSLQEIEEIIQRERPNALVVIPYDNPTGQLYTHQMLVDLAKLCVKYDMWMISDEAYRELYYVDHCEGAVSIWALTEMEVPGITGLRISIETASKVWNGCGLRVGALVTDCRDLHLRLVAENTVNLCTNTLGQWIFGAIAHLSHGEIRAWFQRQRDHYRPLMEKFHQEMEEALPGVIVSRADASLYEVVDLRHLVNEKFSADGFVVWCASEGFVEREGQKVTLLTAPMPEFYNASNLADNLGRTQLRIAFVESAENLAQVPDLLSALFRRYLELNPQFKREA